MYGKVKDLYAAGGRPSVDPVVLVKMWLLGYLYGISSERRLEQEVHMNLGYRWFLGLPLDQRVPDHSTLSVNRNRRFRETELFLGIFEAVVDMCEAGGLVTGKAVVTDSTHVKANASNEQRETVTVTQTPRQYWRELEEMAQQLNDEQREKRGGKKRGRPPQDNGPKQRQVTKSTTDPDAGMMGRPGKPNGFHYLAHMTIDPAHGVIVNAKTTPADISDHEPYVECIQQTKRRFPVDEAAADAGYDFPEVHKGLTGLGVTGYIPGYQRRSGLDTGRRFGVTEFAYNPESDTYTCPQGCSLRFTHVNDKSKVYAAKTSDCKTCPLRHLCLSPSTRFRQLKRPLLQDYVDQAHARIGSPRYCELQRLRRIWCEGTFAILKARHCLDRAMRRGIDKVHEQVLMAASALNLIRLATARA